jgi:hypothetical protein
MRLVVGEAGGGDNPGDAAPVRADLARLTHSDGIARVPEGTSNRGYAVVMLPFQGS